MSYRQLRVATQTLARGTEAFLSTHPTTGNHPDVQMVQIVDRNRGWLRFILHCLCAKTHLRQNTDVTDNPGSGR